MTPDRWRGIESYQHVVFGDEDDALKRITARAVEAGLPDISIGPEVGRLICILAALAAEGAGDRPPRALEIGTLAGYSGVWLARGLGSRGTLVTLEIEERHADVARRSFAETGLNDRVDLRLGDSADLLPELAEEVGPGGLDLVFLDGEKASYEDEFCLVRPLLRAGGLFIADNALGSNSWCITDSPGSSESRDAVDRLNRRIAVDPGFMSVTLPLRQGVLVARRMQAG